MKILVTDDNECNRYQLQVLLSGSGYEVMTAANGAEALDQARQEAPDLIVADILMPVMDGYSLCRVWKQDERLRNIPFVFYTATYTDEQDRELALRLGAQRFIVKPEEPDVFVRIIREVVAQAVPSPPAPAGALSAESSGGQGGSAAPTEAEYLHQYNAVLVRKLEQKLVELEREVAERRRTEQVLRDSEERYRVLFEGAVEGIAVADAATREIRYANPAYCALYGYSKDELEGMTIEKLHPPDAAVNIVSEFDAGTRGERELLPSLPCLRKNGSVFWAEFRSRRVVMGGGPMLVGFVTDVTERRQLEAQFLRAQRLESIGAMAGGLAHDLNNILSPILMIAPLLSDTVADPEGREMLGTVQDCAQRGADLVKQLLTFARGAPTARVPLPVRHHLREISRMIRETFPRNIRLQTEVRQELWHVLADATQIHQALMNLCVNARDAMPAGGVLTLAAANVNLDAAFAEVTPHAAVGPYVCMSVTDTGSGIPPENLDRIFDPFFTTKETGKGTGLGLATVLGIVRGHGGFVRVKSRLGQGTMFELYLPASVETEPVRPSRRPEAPPAAKGELILVVDDEAAVRSVVRRTLERHGYRVVLAAEGSEALALWKERASEIRAVITDLMMPGVEGPALIRALRRSAPQVPILGMTGLAERTGVQGLDSLDLPALLTKPFVGTELLTKLQELITGRQTRRRDPHRSSSANPET